MPRGGTCSASSFASCFSPTPKASLITALHSYCAAGAIRPPREEPTAARSDRLRSHQTRKASTIILQPSIVGGYQYPRPMETGLYGKPKRTYITITTEKKKKECKLNTHFNCKHITKTIGKLGPNQLRNGAWDEGPDSGAEKQKWPFITIAVYAWLHKQPL